MKSRPSEELLVLICYKLIQWHRKRDLRMACRKPKYHEFTVLLYALVCL